MAVTMYRLTKAKYANTPFDCIGSVRSAGRRHQAGVLVVYASDAPASALLEIVAHAEAASLLAHAYVLISIDLEPDRHLLMLERKALPVDWCALDWPALTQRVCTTILSIAQD